MTTDGNLTEPRRQLSGMVAHRAGGLAATPLLLLLLLAVGVGDGSAGAATASSPASPE